MASALLGVAADASVDEARRAYRARARLLHPDRLAGMSERDADTAHAAMAQLNEAMAVFEAHPGEGPTRSQSPDPQGGSQVEPELVGRFAVMLSSGRGGGIAGTILIFQTPDHGRAPIFRSDDLDVRGQPLLMGPVSLLPNEKPHFAGRLDLAGGGYIVVKGGKGRAQELMKCLRGGPKSSTTRQEPRDSTQPKSRPPQSQPTQPQHGGSSSGFNLRVRQLDGLAGEGSTFEIGVAPGEVSISCCVAHCTERGYHSCALGVDEVEDLVSAVSQASHGADPAVVMLPPELDDIAITRLNPGHEPPAILVDWRSNWNRVDDGDAADRAWRCVTLHLQGSSARPSSQVSQFLRTLSTASSFARLWEDGEVDADQVLQGMKGI